MGTVAPQTGFGDQKWHAENLQCPALLLNPTARIFWVFWNELVDGCKEGLIPEIGEGSRGQFRRQALY